MNLSMDFAAKMQIALKECHETEYWIKALSLSGILDEAVSKSLLGQCGTIRRVLIATLNTVKGNNG